MILPADISSRLTSAIERAFVGSPIRWRLAATDYRAVIQAKAAAEPYLSAAQAALPSALLGLPYEVTDAKVSVLEIRRRDTGALESIPV